MGTKPGLKSMLMAEDIHKRFMKLKELERKRQQKNTLTKESFLVDLMNFWEEN